MVYESKLEGIDRMRFQFCIVDEAHNAKRVAGAVNNFLRQFDWDSLIWVTDQEVRTNIPADFHEPNVDSDDKAVRSIAPKTPRNVRLSPLPTTAWMSFLLSEGRADRISLKQESNTSTPSDKGLRNKVPEAYDLGCKVASGYGEAYLCGKYTPCKKDLLKAPAFTLWFQCPRHGACVATLNDEQHSIKVKFYDVVEPHLLQQIWLVQLFEPFAQKDNCQQLFSPDEFLPFEEYGPLCEETNPEIWTTSLELQFQNARCCPLEL
ncbi:hypothetical protein FGLOB1_1376 [Fusarium globosum]|uniref:SNF2 N-terminal domain-containing protein n=1 Tax=Fusarium globosum TaxID=78864 RepID=A0A8H6DL02_9HYPO|nr:hypothetical protein FGLOB1_1376 [Fusarium globosum]